MIANLTPRLRKERAVPELIVAVLMGSLIFYMHGTYGHGDINVYRSYARAFWLGSPPLHSLPTEYPLLSLVPFTLTLLPPLPDSITVFGLWMLLLLLVVSFAIRHHESTRAAEVCGVYLALGGFATVLGRYDLFPAAATLVAYWAARHRRFRLAYGMLAVGTLLKLYPLFLLPILVIEQYRTLEASPLHLPPPRPVLQGLAVFSSAVAGVCAVTALLEPGSWLSPVAFDAHRPLQVESVPASLLWLSGLAGLPIHANRSFNSYNLVGQIDGLLGVVSVLALVGGCLLVYWRQLNGGIAFGRALTLCLLVVICTGRVLSPQYLIWVLPLVAIMEPRYDRLWLAVCALTTLVFPFAYDWTGMHGRPLPHEYQFYLPALIAVRNALLVVATAQFAKRSWLVRSEMREFRQRPPSVA